MRGRFEHTAKSFLDLVSGGQRCDFISFDTNMHAEANDRHWHAINTFLQRPGTVMLMQHQAATGVASYCNDPRQTCTFSEQVSISHRCCSDPEVIPSNMHPQVWESLRERGEWVEVYSVGKW